MRPRLGWVTSAAALLLAGCGAPDDTDSGSPDAASYLGADRTERFDSYVKTIGDVQLVSKAGLALLDTTWEEQLRAPRQRFVSATSAGDVYYALVSLKNSFHDGHATLAPDPTWHLTALPAALEPEARQVSLPLAVRVEYDGGRPAYRVVDGQGIAAGSTLESVDGATMADLERQLIAWYPLHSPEGLREWVADSVAFQDAALMPAARAGDVAHLVVTDPASATRNVELTWAAVPSTPPPVGCAAFRTAEASRDYAGRKVLDTGANYCIYDGGAPDLRVVRYWSFLYPSLDAMLSDEARLLHDLEANGVARVLFDVRENGGGSFEFAPSFFGSFATAPYSIFSTRLYFAPTLDADPRRIDDVIFLDPPAATSVKAFHRENPDATFSERMLGLLDDGATKRTYPPAPGAHFRAVVLTGPWCASSCDHFVSIMRDNGIAKLAGLPSAAADSPFRYGASLALADGTAFDIVLTVGESDRPNHEGLVLEGHPPPIDFPVWPTSKNRGGYLDAVLAAVTWPP